MRTALWTCVVLAVLAGGGCGRAELAAPPDELTAAQRNFTSLWRASFDVLRDYRFDVDWFDRRSGTIHTERMTAMHFTEFWRKDSTTPRQVAESSLQTIYRTARVEIHPVGDAEDRFKAVVRVETARSDEPALQVTSTSQARELYTGTAKRHLEVRRHVRAEVEGEGGVVQIGRDEALERRLTEDIRARAADLAAADPTR
ncbi:MAG: hypothetical protein ACOC8F_06625 [Planctomycetota bacterium]